MNEPFTKVTKNKESLSKYALNINNNKFEIIS